MSTKKCRSLHYLIKYSLCLKKFETFQVYGLRKSTFTSHPNRCPKQKNYLPQRKRPGGAIIGNPQFVKFFSTIARCNIYNIIRKLNRNVSSVTLIGMASYVSLCSTILTRAPLAQARCRKLGLRQ
jgi:hypothetical protein